MYEFVDTSLELILTYMWLFSNLQLMYMYVYMHMYSLHIHVHCTPHQHVIEWTIKTVQTGSIFEQTGSSSYS